MFVLGVVAGAHVGSGSMSTTTLPPFHQSSPFTAPLPVMLMAVLVPVRGGMMAGELAELTIVPLKIDAFATPAAVQSGRLPQPLDPLVKFASEQPLPE